MDNSGNLYLVGYGDTTWGSPVQAFGGSNNAAAVKIDNSGNLVWNTFLGGSTDYGNGIAVDGAGNVVVTGYSTATWGTPWRSYSGLEDIFVAQLNIAGSRTWNTFLGSSGTDVGNGVAMDGSGGVYLTGQSSATWGSPVRPYTALDDGFVAKISALPPAGISVAPTNGLTTTEAGATATFTVVLNSAPTANVTIGLSSSDTTEGTVSTSSLTFTSANWNTPQTVTLTGVDDTLDDGDIAYGIVTAAAVSADGNYNGLNASDVSVSNNDNDSYNTLVVTTANDTVNGDTTSIASLVATPGADGISLREAITDRKSVV
jgi:hypothetical protein